MKPYTIDFDLLTGICKSGIVQPVQRRVSQMKMQFADPEAAQKAIDSGDPVLYEFSTLLNDEKKGTLAFGSTIIYPGKIGDEYYMTKGHFHTILDSAEVYYCLSGKGFMMMETPEGDVDLQEVHPGEALYVPGRWAHRSINHGTEPFVMLFVYPGDSGHDYGTIETKGYRKLVVERDGKPVMIDNPRWK